MVLSRVMVLHLFLPALCVPDLEVSADNYQHYLSPEPCKPHQALRELTNSRSIHGTLDTLCIGEPPTSSPSGPHPFSKSAVVIQSNCAAPGVTSSMSG